MKGAVVGPPAWLAGVVTGIAVVTTLGMNFALFASGIGIVFAAVGAFWAGAAIAAVLEPQRSGRNAAIVATSILATIVLFLAIAFSRPPPPGTSSGGPNVLPPASQQP